eukprot:ANDGO_00494.mRNA.1 hypothetical protein
MASTRPASARIVAALIVDHSGRKSKAINKYLREAHLFSPLAAMAADRDDSVAKTGLDTLWNISARDVSMKDVLKALSMIPLLVHHLKSSPMPVQLSACGLLSNLVLDDKCCYEVTSIDGVECVIALLDIREVPELHTRALSCLWNLCANHASRERALTLRLPERILGFVSSPNRFIQEKACGCFGELALMSGDAARSTVRAKGIQILVKALKPILASDSTISRRDPRLDADRKSDKTIFSMVLALASLSLGHRSLIVDLGLDPSVVYNLIRSFCSTYPMDHEFGWSWLKDEVSHLKQLLTASPERLEISAELISSSSCDGFDWESAHCMQLFGCWLLRYVLRSQRSQLDRMNVLLSGSLSPLVGLTESADWSVRHHACALLSMLDIDESLVCGGSLGTDLKIFLKSPLGIARADVSVDGVAAHSTVLAARSPLFRSMMVLEGGSATPAWSQSKREDVHDTRPLKSLSLMSLLHELRSLPEDVAPHPFSSRSSSFSSTASLSSLTSSRHESKSEDAAEMDSSMFELSQNASVSALVDYLYSGDVRPILFPGNSSALLPPKTRAPESYFESACTLILTDFLMTLRAKSFAQEPLMWLSSETNSARDCYSLARITDSANLRDWCLHSRRSSVAGLSEDFEDEKDRYSNADSVHASEMRQTQPYLPSSTTFGVDATMF